MDFKNFKSLSNVHYLWSHDFLNFDDIFKNDRVRGGLQSDKIKKPPGMFCFKWNYSQFSLKDLKGRMHEICN